MSDAAQLQEAVERMHGVTATLVQSAPVHEAFEGETVWEGVVHVFDLADHPTAVLHQPPVDGPQAAVRAAIVGEHRARREKQ